MDERAEALCRGEAYVSEGCAFDAARWRSIRSAGARRGRAGALPERTAVSPARRRRVGRAQGVHSMHWCVRQRCTFSLLLPACGVRVEQGFGLSRRL